MMIVKMCKTMLVIILCMELSMVLSAPLLQMLQPYQRITVPPSQQNLQQQLLELQMMQQFNPMSQFGPNQLQPFVILLPDQSINTNINMKPHADDRIDNELNSNHETKTNGDEDDLNSVIIDAAPMPILEEQKAFLVIPNGRLSIGDLVSAIPFLPIEINVPDTISWIYNGISGIISIIGSRLPFQRPTEVTSMKNVNLKSIIDEFPARNKINGRPLIIMPLGALRGPLLPVRF